MGGRVTVHDLSHAAGQRQLVQHRVVSLDDAGHIHKFPQPENALVREHFFHILRVELRPRVLKRRGGHAGGHRVKDIELRSFRRFQHITKAVEAADVGDLVRVGDDGGGASGDEHSPRLFGTHKGRFDMDMRVDESRRGKATLRVDRLAPLVARIRADNHTGFDGNLPRLDRSRKNVDNPAVFQHEIRLFPARRRVNPTLERFFFRHIRPSVAPAPSYIRLFTALSLYTI